MTIKTHNYETQNTSDVVFKRLRIDVEEHNDPLVNPSWGFITIDTRKPWVGQINEVAGTFKVVKTNPSAFPVRILEGNFFTIIIHGRVFADKSKTRIQVRYKVHILSATYIIFACFAPVLLASMFIWNGEWEKLQSLTGWFLIVTIFVLILFVQVSATATKISELLGAKQA